MESSKNISSQFYYVLSNLNISPLTSQLSVIENLLSGLFPNDHGDESPSWVNCFQARSMINGKITEQGKPYLWAQRLAGLDFNGIVKSTPQSFINTEFVETVFLYLNHNTGKQKQ